jgi:hypothetical protein
MAAFEKVTYETQEQFDTAIQDRLARYKTQITEEVKAGYADYEDLKAKATKLDEYDEKEKAWNTEKTDYETKLKDATSKLHVYETESKKAKAIKAAGIPAEAWDDASALIKGETDEEIKQSVEALQKLLGGKKQDSPPRKDAELGGEKGDDSKSEYAELLRQMKQGDE